MAVTRNDVARKAGVSPAVVSYVLNDGPRPVSQASRAKVLAAVDELGYRPDGLARSLRVGRSETLGLVIPDAANPFFAELARAVEDAAYAVGHAVLVCNSADDVDRERAYIASLAERRVGGLLLVSASAHADLRDLTDLRIPVLALDRSPDEAPVSTIRVNNVDGAQAGTRHLVAHGRRDIAFVGGTDAGVTAARQRGFGEVLEADGLTPHSVVNRPYTFEGGMSAARALVAHGTVPDAALVASDVQALGLIRGLRDNGIRVPEDVAVVAFDGTRAGRFAVPRLASVAQPLAAMSEAAVRHLVTPERDPVHLAFDSALIPGESCGCEVPR